MSYCSMEDHINVIYISAQDESFWTECSPLIHRHARKRTNIRTCTHTYAPKTHLHTHKHTRVCMCMSVRAYVCVGVLMLF